MLQENHRVQLTAMRLQPLVGVGITSIKFNGRYSRGDVNVECHGSKIVRITSKGLYLVLHLENKMAIMSTLGQGEWTWNTEMRERDDQFDRAKIALTSGETLVFVDRQNFGVLKYVTLREMKRKLAEVGPDILTPMWLWHAVSIPEFKERIRRFGKNMTVGDAMKDQRIVAGGSEHISSTLAQVRPGVTKLNIAELSEETLSEIWVRAGEIASS